MGITPLGDEIQADVMKRVSVLFLVISIPGIILLEHRWIALIGLVIGGIFSIIKFRNIAGTFAKVLSPGAGSNMGIMVAAKYIVNQMATIALLVISLLLDPWLFAGIVAGILLVPLALTIKGIGEAFKRPGNPKDIRR